MADETTAQDKTPTHTAFAFKREGKGLRFGRWLEIGAARTDRDGVMHVFLDRLPIGGFTGYVYLAPAGGKPPVPDPQPQRSAASVNDEGEVGE